ncbi:hypothetical protein BCR33DRAFT_470335, partial [Rhizoclosmatium globosum]
MCQQLVITRTPPRYRCISYSNESKSDIQVPSTLPPSKSVAKHHTPQQIPLPNSQQPTAKTFECTQCLKTFTKKAYLKSHWVSHSDEYPYLCRLQKRGGGGCCTKRFRRSQDLVRHERTVR